MDAEGFNEETPCPECGSINTVTYRYVEGFSELECPTCGYRSDSQELTDLTRYQGSLAERSARPGHPFDDRVPADDLPPVPIRAMKA
ncbi:MAG TPA: hypothetical protein VFN03_07650 [Trueperaceae bacterium]|nr:hypothetical protein [Trueperaceae bacterium]